MTRRILVPLDGSLASEAALWHAAAIVDAMADGLLLLRVLQPGGGDDEEGIENRFLRTEATAYLDQMAERLSEQGADVTTTVAVGGVADEIVRHSEREDVTMVVLTSHGGGAASAFSLGGTAQKVLSRLETSVMVVRPEAASARSASAIRYDRVLVPVDGSTASEWALFPAASIAQRHAATLHVLHVMPETPRTGDRLPPSPEEEDLLERLTRIRFERGERYLREVEHSLTRDDLRVEGRLLQTPDAAEEVTMIATQPDVDLIALDARCATNARVRLGSVARALLDGCSAPIIVLQGGQLAAGREAARGSSRG
jgi:nucleotide-binding universal stress UspA family protein